MEDKIIVDVFVPALDKSYITKLPLISKVSDVTQSLSKMIMDMPDNYYKTDDNAVLCFKDSGTIININLSVYEAGLSNGVKLMLI